MTTGRARAWAGQLASRVVILASLMRASRVVILALLMLASPTMVLAATPAPTGPGGDTRSTGEGPGLVGEPLLAILLVAAIALVSLLATLAYVRVTADRPGSRPPGH